MRCLVTGAGGFIGGHLVRRLLSDGHEVVGADIKNLGGWWQSSKGCRQFPEHDLRLADHVNHLPWPFDRVYNLACDMGGIGFIEQNKADCMVSVLINTNLLRAAVQHEVKRYFYSSSACVYHAERQDGSCIVGGCSLTEDDAYFNGGAMPEDGYGWEKLFSERMCRHFHEDHGLETRVGRFHNIYGPQGSWCDGREKAPAAMCRKIAGAKVTGRDAIDVWGDGSQLRSYCWIDDCVEGIIRLTESGFHEPVNIGSSELVSVNDLVSIVEEAAGYPVRREYLTNMPQGVKGRNSDNTLVRQVLGWSPQTSLQEGIVKTYPWIEQRVMGRNSN